MIPQVDPTSPVLIEPEGTTIQRGTDIRFLRRLARRNGFDCYVQPEPLSGLDIGHFAKRQLIGLPQAVINVSFGERHECVRASASATSWRSRRWRSPRGLDVTTKAPQPGPAPASLQPPLGLEGTLVRELPPGMVRPTGTGLTHAGDLQGAAQAIVDRSDVGGRREGTVGADVGVLRPGGLIASAARAGSTTATTYVTRVQHTLGPGRYEQRFEAMRNAVTETGAEVYLEVPA